MTCFRCVYELIKRGDPVKDRPERVYDLAYHFSAAGDEKKLLAYSILAGEEAKQNYALELAISHSKTALEHSSLANSRMRYRIHTALGEAYVSLGSYETASDCLRNAIENTEIESEKARVELIQGNIAYHSKPMSESVKTYERALRRLGHFIPRTRFGFQLAYAFQSLLLAYRLRIHDRWPPREESPNEQA